MKRINLKKICAAAICTVLIASAGFGDVNGNTAYAASGASAFYNTHWTNKGPAGIAFDLVFYSNGTWFSQDYGFGTLTDEGTWSYDNGDLILDGQRYKRTSEPNDELGYYVCDTANGYLLLYGTNVDKSSTSSKNNATKGNKDIEVYIYGEKIEWTDAKPYIDSKGRTMVPLRDVADGMEIDVKWNANAKTAVFTGVTFYYEDLGQTHCDTTVEFKLGSNKVKVKYKDVFGKVVNKTITMDTALVIKDGRVYAPIKYLANAFARDVKWDGTKREITLQGADFESPFE